MADLLTAIADATVAGLADRVRTLAEEAIAAGVSAEQILYGGLLPGLATVSEQFDGSIVHIPEVLLACRAMHAGMRVLRPVLASSEGRRRIRVVIGTVAGDLHDIGKALAIVFIETLGLEVIDLGVDVHPEEFVSAIREHRPQILALSALLTTSMPMIGATLKALEEGGLRHRVRVIVGGAPVTADYARAVGADWFAPDAVSGMHIIEDWLQAAPVLPGSSTGVRKTLLAPFEGSDGFDHNRREDKRHTQERRSGGAGQGRGGHQ